MADEQKDAETPVERTWPVVVTLKHPIDFDDERITSLSFREGRLRDLKGIKAPTSEAEGLPIDQLMLIASRMCGQPLKVIESLKGSDGAEALAFARDFFVASLTGGGMR